MLVWLNGRIVPSAQARVSALDRGLLHGDGVYDTWRTYDGVPFALAAHLRRLTAATRLLGLPRPEPAERWAERTQALLRRNALPDAAVRLTITRGDAGDAVLPTRPAPPTMLLTLRPLPPDLDRQQADGVAVVLLPFPRDNASWWGRTKLLGHASAVVGKMRAKHAGAAEGLYVTPDGEVTEGTTSNLFLVERDGSLVTPPMEAGVLGGVTRDLILRAARRAGLATCEERIDVARLRGAAEVLVTASTIEVLPVVRLDGRAVGHGAPGPVTLRLQALYRREVARVLARGRAAATPAPRRSRR